MSKKKHIGSSFESFLEEENILEEVNAAAVKAVIVQNLKQHRWKINSISKQSIHKRTKK